MRFTVRKIQQKQQNQNDVVIASLADNFNEWIDQLFITLVAIFKPLDANRYKKVILSQNVFHDLMQRDPVTTLSNFQEQVAPYLTLMTQCNSVVGDWENRDLFFTWACDRIAYLKPLGIPRIWNDKEYMDDTVKDYLRQIVSTLGDMCERYRQLKKLPDVAQRAPELEAAAEETEEAEALQLQPQPPPNSPLEVVNAAAVDMSQVQDLLKQVSGVMSTTAPPPASVEDVQNMLPPSLGTGINFSMFQKLPAMLPAFMRTASQLNEVIKKDDAINPELAESDEDLQRRTKAASSCVVDELMKESSPFNQFIRALPERITSEDITGFFEQIRSFLPMLIPMLSGLGGGGGGDDDASSPSFDLSADTVGELLDKFETTVCDVQKKYGDEPITVDNRHGRLAEIVSVVVTDEAFSSMFDRLMNSGFIHSLMSGAMGINAQNVMSNPFGGAGQNKQKKKKKRIAIRTTKK